MRQMRIILAIVFCSFPAIAFAAYEQDEVLVRVAKIQQMEIFDTYKSVGICAESVQKEYNASVKGRVDFVANSDDQYVEEGQILLTIDRHVAEAARIKAEEIYQSAFKSHNRNISLGRREFVSDEVLERSKVTLENAKMELVLAQEQYDDMVIKAPFSGHIGVIMPNVNDSVHVGDHLFTIVKYGEKIVDLSVPETIHKKIAPGSRVFVIDNNGQETEGEVVSLSNYVHDNGLVAVKTSFPANAAIMHGSYVEVIFRFNYHQGLVSEERSISRNNTGSFVYKVIDGVANQIYVKTGVRVGDFVEVLSDDIGVGDQVVTEGLTKISVGSKVKIVEE